MRQTASNRPTNRLNFHGSVQELFRRVEIDAKASTVRKNVSTCPPPSRVQAHWRLHGLPRAHWLHVLPECQMVPTCTCTAGSWPHFQGHDGTGMLSHVVMSRPDDECVRNDVYGTPRESAHVAGPRMAQRGVHRALCEK